MSRFASMDFIFLYYVICEQLIEHLPREEQIVEHKIKGEEYWYGDGICISAVRK